jgi:hypothetical protein
MQGLTFPAMNVLIASWSPPVERSTISSIAYSGSNRSQPRRRTNGDVVIKHLNKDLQGVRMTVCKAGDVPPPPNNFQMPNSWSLTGGDKIDSGIGLSYSGPPGYIGCQSGTTTLC